MRFLRLLSIGLALLLLGQSSYSQQLKLGKNPYSVQKSAVLELNSDNQGLLLVRISDTAMINSLAPPDGMMIFYTPSKELLIRSNGYWKSITSSGSLSNYWSIAGNSNGVIKQFGNVDDFDLPIITNNIERMRISNAGKVGIGASLFDASNPEQLLVDAGNTSSFNVISGKGTINNYLQLNIQNRSNGTTASSDVVASADNSTETSNFVDLGINSSGFTNTGYPVLGGLNTAYLYSTGTDFVIGNATASRNLRFFTGGYAAANERLRIDGNGRVGLGVTSPSAFLHLKAGAAAANSAPLKFTSGPLTTTAASGAVEFLTDKFYGTIATGNARKEFTLNDAALGVGLIPVTTTNGRLTTNTNLAWDNTNSRLGIMQTTPTAYLQLGAGTATASTAPLKFTAGTNLTTPENGVFEFDGSHFYATIGSTRHQLDQQTGTTYTGSNGITLSGTDFRNNLITGMAGGQTVTGGTDASDALTLSSTNHLTKGKILFGTSAYDEANNRLGIGNSAPGESLDITGNLKFSGALMPNNNAGTSGYLLRSNGAGAAPTWINLGLGNLSDATITSPAVGQILMYNGTSWTNITPVIDTSNISNFSTKVRSVLGAGTGLSYNPGTGVFSNAGVTSVNGNTGALTMDTTYITNFHVKSRSLLNAGAGITYNNATGTITNSGVTSINGNTGALTMDTGYISSFHQKVRSLFSAGTGVSYNSATGVISSSLIAGDFWNLSGNTVTSVKKFGTVDNYDLPFVTNNIERMRIDNAGRVGIGNSAPGEALDITGNLKFSGALMPNNNAGTSGYLLRSNGAGAAPTWINLALSNLADATITSPAAGQILVYNGTRWTNIAPVIDTSNIANFSTKVRSVLSVGTGLSYNAGTGVFNNAGVTSVNGNTGALTMDTGYINNFHIKSRSLINAGAGISYNSGTGTITNSGVRSLNGNTGVLTMDTGYIANFHTKVKSLFSAGTGVSYNAATGVISSSFATGDFWNLSGNTVTSIKKFGTVDNYDLPFVTNNIERMRIDNAGKVGIGTTPSVFFHVKAPGAAGPVSLGLFEGSQAAGSGNYSYLQIANSAVNNSKTALLLGGTTATKQWILGNDAFGNNGQNFYIYDVATASTRMFIDNNGNIGVGNYTFDALNPEKFVVDAGNTSSFNVISGKGTINNYLQLNIQNKSNGASASSDLVSTADNGNESVNYVDLGINSSGYTGTGILAGVNTGYLYSTGNDFMIGNATANKNLVFFTGGTGTTNERMRIDGTGRVGIGVTSLNNYLEVGGTNTTTGVSGLRLTNLGTATTATANSKMLSVNSNGDIIVTNNPSATNWLYTGNSGINPAVNFLGTTDDKQMILKSNNQSYMEFGRRQTLGLTQAYPDYTDNDEKLIYLRSALQFEAAGADFYKPKIFTDANGNFRIKGSSAGTDFFELGSTGTANNGGFEFIIGDDGDEPMVFKSYHYINGMSEIMRLQSGRMAVGSNAFDATNPEKLLIDAGNTTSYNLMTGKGSIDNYLQINVQNRSAGGSASSDLVATSNNGSESSNFIDMGINSGSYSNTSIPVLGGANTAYLYSTGNDLVMGNATANRNFRFFTGGTATSNERMRIDGDGNVGIGATAFDGTAPEKLLIDAGATTSYNLINAKGNINNYLQFNITNESAGLAASTDIVATNNSGSETARFIDMGINSSGYSNTGILGGANNAYLYATGSDLIIGNATTGEPLRFFTGGTATSNERMRIDGSGNVGIGTTSPAFPLAVNRSGSGTLISLQKDGTAEGSISVSAFGTVSYNAFTGSHYAWTSQSIEQGALVTLTGKNQYFHNNKSSEIIYGVEPSAQANDPKVMGAYLGLQEGGSPYSVDNPNLVMAVGNGVMWVVDKGEDIAIGDYLISSDVTGHAMKENGTYPTAYVVARVAEPVKWSSETQMINGVKHKLISVFFESFVQNNAQKELEVLKKEMKELQERMLKIENKISAGQNQP
jgi:hypothetical protein